MAITYVGAGAGAGSITTVAPALPAALAVDDILILVAESANQAITITNQAGGTWSQIATQQGTGTAAGTTATRCGVWWSRYNGTQTAPTLGDAGDHVAGRIYAFRGCLTSASVINTSIGSIDATSDTSLTATGSTTTVADCLVVICATLMDDAQDFGATWTNASLTNITVRDASFGHSAGNDGRLILVTGDKAVAGAYTTTTNTLTVASTKGMVTFALAPAAVVGGAATLTPAVLKLVGVALSPVAQPNTVTITPAVLKLVGVALSPAGVAGTILTPATLKLVAVAVSPVGSGPSLVTLTPATLRLAAVPVTATPGQVTTTITPAVLRLVAVPPVLPYILETFNTGDGTPLGPDLTWTREVHLAATEWEVAANQARYQAIAVGTEIDHYDLQIPTPNIAVADQTVSFPVTLLDHGGTGSYVAEVAAFVRFATFAGDTEYRGYVASISRIDALNETVWLILARHDAVASATILSFQFIGDLGTQMTLPGTLTLTARGDQIFASFTHAGLGRTLFVAAKDATYATGEVAVRGHVNVNGTDTATVEIDDFLIAAAPAGPETTTITPAVLKLRPGVLIPIVETVIDGGDTATPPTDIYDAGDTATPPDDIVDPESPTTTINPPTLRLLAVPLSPVGVPPITATPAVLRLTAVPLSPLGVGPGEATLNPPTLRLDAIPVTATPGVVTTTITPAVLRLTAVAFPFGLIATVNLNIEIGPTRSRAQTATSATRPRAATTVGASRSRAQVSEIDETRVGTLVGVTRNGSS